MIVTIKSRATEYLKETEWYKWEHPNFDYVENYEAVKSICGDNIFCLMDSVNWTLMNKTPLTESMYKWITHRVYIFKSSISDEISNTVFDYGVLGELIFK